MVGDPEVSLTEADRKRMYDMAMEMHDLQRRVGEVNTALSSVRSQIPAVSKTVEGRSDLPAEVKTSVSDLDKELGAMIARLAPPQGGRGGGGGGGRGNAPDTPISRLNAAKTGLMGGMPATSQTHDAYKRAKSEVPKTIDEARALLTKVQTVSVALAKHNITLTVTQ